MEPISNFEEIDFQKYLLVLQRRWISTVGVFSVVVALASLHAFSRESTYTAEANILIKTSSTSSLTDLGETLGKIESLARESNPLETQVKIISSHPIIQETIDYLELKNKDNEPLSVKHIKSSLSVKGQAGTDIINISYTAKDPELAARIANGIVNVYKKSNMLANRAEAVSTRQFIAKQLPTTEMSVKNADSALRKFKERYRIITLEEESKTAVKNISELENQISQAQAELANVDASLVKLRNRAKVNLNDAVESAELSQIPGTQKVLEQLQEAQSLLAVNRSRFQPTHPRVISLEAKVNALKDLLNNRLTQVSGNQPVRLENIQLGELRQKLIADIVAVETKRAGLENKIAVLSNKWSSYKERANILPRLEETQRELERKLEAAQITYESLLRRRQEVQVTENQNIGNARIISPALVPDKPDASKKKLMVAAGGIVGILLGIIVAFILDLIDRSLKTVKEAKEIFGYTLLSVIPTLTKTKSKKGAIYLDNLEIPKVAGRDIPQFPIGDSYQILQANLKFLISDKPLKAIVVTSSVSKEGKSSVAANLAVAVSEIGRKVLLIDADMRHPVQHHVWGMTNSVGLSNVIVDQIPTDVAIQKATSNLDILPSGILPPNPVALLDSKRMENLVDTLVNQYDFVIFDTPALAGTADASVLNKLVDGTLLVVRPGVVDWSNAKAAKDFLTQSEQNVLGMVVNGVNIKREPDSYFYYKQESADSNVAPTPNTAAVR
ncbi:MAG: polysaccharide biosynthesis tyrosine autokinase [Cyanobacteria bacterium P01_A01_bin.84]